MKYGKGTLTTIYDRVNFYRDIHDDPNVTFKREGDKITLISGDGTIINDKLIAKSEDAFDHKFDTYTPLKKQLNENQQQVLGWLKTGHCSGDRVFEALERVTYVYEDPKTEESLESLSPDQEVQVITTFMQWALEQEEE